MARHVTWCTCPRCWTALRAEVRDLKARLKALKVLWGEHNKCGCDDCMAVARVADTRRKNWRGK